MTDNNREFDKKLKARVASSEKRKDNWKSLWRECYEYALPQRENMDDEHDANTQGEHKNEDRTYDSTARLGTITFANTIQSVLMPSGSQWAKLIASDKVAEEAKQQVNEKLEEITKTIFRYIDASNMAVEVGESLLELAIGTAAFVIEDTGDADDPIRFQSIPIQDLILEEGPSKRVETVFRKWKVSLRNVERQYNAMAPDRMDEYEQNPEAMIVILEGVVYNPKTKMYDWYVVDWDKDYVLNQAEYESSPYVVSRWIKVPGETYGRGPIVHALPDIRTANEVAEYDLINAEYAVKGLHTYDAGSGVIGHNIRLEPGALISVPSGAELKSLEVGSELRTGQLVLERLQDNIKQALFSDRLPPPTEGGIRTATEISYRQRELQQSIGSSFGRLQNELIVPIIERVLWILTKYDIIEDIIVDKQTVQIKVNSPISRNNEEVDNVLNYIEALGGALGELSPETIAQEVNLSALPKWLAENMGVPLALLYSDEEKEQNAADAAPQIEAENDLAMGEQASGIAKNLGVTGEDLQALQESGQV